MYICTSNLNFNPKELAPKLKYSAGRAKGRVHFIRGGELSEVGKNRYAVAAKKALSQNGNQPKLNCFQKLFFILYKDGEDGTYYKINKLSLRKRLGITAQQLKKVEGNAPQQQLLIEEQLKRIKKLETFKVFKQMLHNSPLMDPTELTPEPLYNYTNQKLDRNFASKSPREIVDGFSKFIDEVFNKANEVFPISKNNYENFLQFVRSKNSPDDLTAIHLDPFSILRPTDLCWDSIGCQEWLSTIKLLARENPQDPTLIQKANEAEDKAKAIHNYHRCIIKALDWSCGIANLFETQKYKKNW